MTKKIILPLLLLLLPTLPITAEGEERQLSFWLNPAVQGVLYPDLNLGAYINFGSRFNALTRAKNYKTGEMVGQDTEGFTVNELSVGPYSKFNLLTLFPLETKLLYRAQYWTVENNSFAIHTVDNRNTFLFDLDFMKLEYRLIFWLKFPHSRHEALYQLKDPSVDPAGADDTGKYYDYDHTRVDYKIDLINRHMLGLIFPLGKAFGATGDSSPLSRLDFFLRFEIFLDYTARQNNEFLTQDHGENIFGDYISVAGSKVGYNEKLWNRYRVYTGFDYRLFDKLSLDLSYIFESNFGVDKYDPVKRGPYNLKVHYVKAGMLYEMDFIANTPARSEPATETGEDTAEEAPAGETAQAPPTGDAAKTGPNAE